MGDKFFSLFKRSHSLVFLIIIDEEKELQLTRYRIRNLLHSLGYNLLSGYKLLGINLMSQHM
jgi:hypothetical protein